MMWPPSPLRPTTIRLLKRLLILDSLLLPRRTKAPSIRSSLTASAALRPTQPTTRPSAARSPSKPETRRLPSTWPPLSTTILSKPTRPLSLRSPVSVAMTKQLKRAMPPLRSPLPTMMWPPSPLRPTTLRLLKRLLILDSLLLPRRTKAPSIRSSLTASPAVRPTQPTTRPSPARSPS